MKVIWEIWRKEVLDVMRDRRRLIWSMIYSLILMPLMFVMPSGFMMLRTQQQLSQTLTIPVQGIENAPELIAFLSKNEDIKVVTATDVELLIKRKQFTVGLIIPLGFEEKVVRGESQQLVVVADQSKSLDVSGTRLVSALEKYRDKLVKIRLEQNNLSSDFLQPFKVEQRNAATATETTGSLLSLLVPGVVLSFGLSAGIQTAVSSTAGEKERLTLEPMLFTPINRLHLVLGKLLAVMTSVFIFLINMTIALGVSILIFVLFVARNVSSILASTPTDAFTTSIPQNGIYSITPLAALLALFSIVPIILLGASIQLALSTWARNSDEAYGYLNPMTFLSTVLLVGMIFLQDFVPSLWQFAIPIFGTILAMRDLLSGIWAPPALGVMLISSLVYAVLALGWAAWMFTREEVVFRT